MNGKNIADTQTNTKKTPHPQMKIISATYCDLRCTGGRTKKQNKTD